MKIQSILTAFLAGLCFTACIDKEEYQAKLPGDPAMEDPKPYALKLDEHKTFKHPGCMAVQEDFDRAKKHIDAGEEPWSTAFNELKKSRFFNRPNTKEEAERLALRLTERNAKGYLIRGSADKTYYVEDLDEYFPKGWGGNFDFEYQATSAAYSKAVYWKLTGDKACADFAVNTLNAWAKHCKGVTGDENGQLAVNEACYDFASVAELLRDYDGWRKEDQDTFKVWMKSTFEVKLLDFLKKHDTAASASGPTHYFSNWDLEAMLALSAMGVYLDRPDLYNYALNYVTYGSGNGNWRRFIPYLHPAIKGEDDIDLGQTQESGRDQGHNGLSIRIGAALCRIAWNQGDDLYGYDDNRFLKGAECVAKYNYGPYFEKRDGKKLTYPFQAGFVNSDGKYFTQYSADGRGLLNPCFVSIYEHYRKYAKLVTRYVNYAAHVPGQNQVPGKTGMLNPDPTKVLIEPETYNHNQGAGSSFGTLLFTEDDSKLK